MAATIMAAAGVESKMAANKVSMKVVILAPIIRDYLPFVSNNCGAD